MVISATPKVSTVTLRYLMIKNVVAPEDQGEGRRRYCGIAKADQFFGFSCDENVRRYLGVDDQGNTRKATAVNLQIRDTIENNRALFPMLNTGIVVVARKAEVDDEHHLIHLTGASIINGAQTAGEGEEFFKRHPDDKDYHSVNFELIVTDNEELIADISIARNFQNRVTDLSIYGRQGRFDKLEEAMRKHDSSIKLRKKETDFNDDLIDTEKLVQVLTAITPKEIPLPSADKRREKTPETLYRVYAYRHRSRCLKDFAIVMDEPIKWPHAYKLFLDIAHDAWQLYKRFKCEQYFSSLKCVKGQEKKNGQKLVAPDGVPDGVVFPMLSALSRFITEANDGWRLQVPSTFPWNTLYEQARIQETTTARFNPQTMGKNADCYVALHGAIDMYFAVSSGMK